jgi:glycosyltransferase involved in cell wall biosynthesis
MKSAPLVNVVTPFYNTREFLPECIESVLRQTYENWEYLLVDNCSTDGSGEIAAHYASRFPDKIRLIHTDAFLSQVQNYNFALSRISPESEYCKMVQADDWIFPDCLRAMVEVAEAHPSVGLVAAYELEGDVVRLDGLPYPSTKVAGRHVGRLYFLRDSYLFGTPTSLLMRAEIVRSRSPFYEERRWPFEDAHACFDVLQAWDFGFVHQILTHTRRGNDSIMAPMCTFNFELLSRLTFVVVHGRNYLSEEEYSRCLKRAERQYLRYLAGQACAVHRRPREFWEFHRSGLETINRSLDWRLLWKWMPRIVLEKIWSAFWTRWDREPREDPNNARVPATGDSGVSGPAF